MRKFIKSACMIAVFSGLMLTSFADRGLRKKSRANQITINVEPLNGIKTNPSLYKVNTIPYINAGSINNTTIKTYQKGNTIYVLPSQKRSLSADFKPGYTGMKLVIKSN